jgi:ATP-dependent Clp endopeptidase proteolytic subunit ClpP
MRKTMLAVLAAAIAASPYPQPNAGPALLRVQALASGDAELLIYGSIGDDYWGESVTAKQVIEDLAALAAKTIQVRINSEGGSVKDGLAIYNALKRHSARKIVTVDGIAASIASLIAMAGDEIIMPANTIMMVHAPWAYAGGNANDMKLAAEMLETYERSMATSYAAKTGKTVDECLALLRDYRDHYYTASEAAAFGLADRVLEDDVSVPATETAAAALFHTLIRNLEITASAPAQVQAHVRSRLCATLTPARFAAMPAARQTAIVATIGDEAMKQKYLSIQANAQAAAGTAVVAADPAAVPAVVATPAAAQPGVAVVATPAAASPEAALAGVQARNTGIRNIFAGFRDQPAIRDLESTVLADTSITLQDAQARLIGVLGAGSSSLAGGGHVVSGQEETDRLRAAATSMLLVRAGTVTGRDADDARNGNPYLNMSLSAIAEHCLIRAGVNTRMLTRDQIAHQAMAQQGTSDFPLILENTLNRMVIAGYNATPFTWTRFCTTGTLSDYRPHNRYYLGSFSDLKAVNEHGEYENGVLSDATKEVIQGQRKGRILQITPEAIVNDDLGALQRPAFALGQAAGRTIEKDVYAMFALNGGFGPTMRDGNALFHASHNNIAAVAAAPSVTAFDAMRVLLASQKDSGGNDFLDITAAIWLGPLSLGGSARVVNGAEYDTEVTNKFQVPNKVRNMFRDVVDTPRLSGTAWYTFADPNVQPTFEVAFLDGITVPTLEQETNFRTDGLSWKVVHRFGTAAVGTRGAARNAGV